MDSFMHALGLVAIFLALYFEVFVLLSVFEKRHEGNDFDPIPMPGVWPAVTVIIPCFNEEKTISKTIESLLSLDYEKDLLKIIIVDDGSTDNSLSILKSYEDNPQIKIFSKENGGKHTALNFGLKHVDTPFVGCLDADSFVDKMALKNIMKRFNRDDVMAVIPSTVIASPNNIIRKMQRAEYSYGNFMRGAYAKMNAVHITPGPFSFFRKEVFEIIGEYRHAYNTEDMEIAMRMQKHKMKIVSALDAVIYTTGPGTIRKLYRQRVRWVSGFIANMLDYKGMVFASEFGDLGLVVLPFALIGIALSLVVIGVSAYDFLSNAIDSIKRLYTVGFQMPQIQFDIFFTNTSVMSLLSLIMLVSVIAMVVWSDRLINKRWSLPIDSLYFLFLYSIIAPFWLVVSLYNNLTSKVAPWR